MKFSLFYGQVSPKPWSAETEQKMFENNIAQCVLADQLGYHCIWASEHHFLEEYAHGSAPEIFLAAVAARTRQIRIGHGIVLMPPKYNHPARVAERISTLDLLSGGRTEFGTGESASAMELDGFGVEIENKREMWQEATAQCLDMMAMTPYPGYSGKYFSMPCRNVVPKPVQTPHPPVWIACSSSETIKFAARNGIGALVFSFVDPAEAKFWVDEYHRTFREECIPIGHAVNPNVAMFTGFGMEHNDELAIERWINPFRFSGYALAHYYIFGEHRPGRVDLAANFEEARLRGLLKTMPAKTAIGSPEKVREALKAYEEVGIDQLGLVIPAAPHGQICDSLELFAREIMPEYQEKAAARERRKAEELAPYIEAAFARKEKRAALADQDIPVVTALGRKIISATTGQAELEAVFSKAKLDAIAAPLYDPLAVAT